MSKYGGLKKFLPRPLAWAEEARPFEP